MPGEPQFDDVVRTLARYAPGDRLARTEWTPDRQAEVLAAIVAPDRATIGSPAAPEVHEMPVRFVAAGASAAGRRGRWSPHLLPLASGLAVVAIATAAAVAVMDSGSGHTGSGPNQPAGAPFDPPPGLSHTAIAAGVYSHRVDEEMHVDAAGRATPNGAVDMVNRNWVAADGTIVSIRTGSQNGCFVFGAAQVPSLQQPTREFLAGLPTEVDALRTYFRAHAQGSSSLDEAVFVAVGDLLRQMDAFASPALRAAMVGVLSRTDGVTVHLDQRDFLDRPAIRADFVDQRIRPDEIQSLYFDPSTFQLLEQRDGLPPGMQASASPTIMHGSDPPPKGAAASPPYTSAATDGPSAEALTGPAYVDLVQTEEVVDELPNLPADCKHG
jgi:hypothetical protein